MTHSVCRAWQMRTSADSMHFRAVVVTTCLLCGALGLHDAKAGWLTLDPTPQRMYHGMIQDGSVVGWSLSREADSTNDREYNACNWYRGHLDSGNIVPLRISEDRQPTPEANQTSTLVRRWYWEDGRMWFAVEALYAALGPGISKLERTKPISEFDPLSPSPWEHSEREWDSERLELTETVCPVTTVLNDKEALEEMSMIPPLTRAVKTMSLDRSFHAERDFYHPRDGFDFIPHDLDHWTLFISVEHTMQIWDCRSRRLGTGKDQQIRNTWKLEYELWVPWRGQFFVIPLKKPDPYFENYVLVRDCGEVHLLLVDRRDRAEPNPDPRLQRDPNEIRWRGRQLLDPVDYLIALIYIEPQNAVYGFGPNFYVRLDDPDSGAKLQRCRNLTRGRATWTDADGNTHELQDPFRTVWQCAQVLKEEGVLDAVRKGQKEEEMKPKESSATTPARTPANR